MIIGSLCLSHSPARDRNRLDDETEENFDSSLSRAANFVAETKPDIAVIFYPDHLNGFFYRLLPSFCIGVQGTSIGDYGTSAGGLNIPRDRAMDLAHSVLRSGVDAAVSWDMQVDHGAMQPLEWLSEIYPIKKIIPIFINCAAPPLPTFERARALGNAVGEWARNSSERILFIGSGGLSHDAPLPDLATAPPEAHGRIVRGEPMEHEQRFSRQSRAYGEGRAMAEGRSTLLPINVDWDHKLLDAFCSGDLSSLDGVSDGMLAEIAGRGGHEVRAWIASLAALGPNYSAETLFYKAIPEWITGMGILKALPDDSAVSA